MIDIIMVESTLDDLADFLEAHEGDIAGNVNDFGGLRYVFIEITGREPEKIEVIH